MSAIAALAGCAQAPQPVAHRYHGHSTHEHFAEGSYWGKASPRMVEDGQEIPRGGGQYLVGRPYHVGGRTYYPQENPHYSAVGMASWYGDAFHGRKTANGEIYDKNALSAAHPTLPLPSYVRVTNLGNGYSVIVRVNDRGPYAQGRVMDMSSRVADVLDFKRIGTAHVKVEYVGQAPLEGSDDNELLATLRTDGTPANMTGGALIADSSTPLLSLFGAGSPPPPPPPPPVAEPEPEPVAAAPAPPPPPPPPPRARRAQPDEDQRSKIDDAAEPPPRRFDASVPLPPLRPYKLGPAREAAVTPAKTTSSERRALYFDATAHRDDPLARLLRRTSTKPLNDDDR